MRQAVEVYRKATPDTWERFRAESLLGATLAGQKRYAEAEPLLLAAYSGLWARKYTSASDRGDLDDVRKRIIDLYAAWDKPEKAAEWRRAAPPE